MLLELVTERGTVKIITPAKIYHDISHKEPANTTHSFLRNPFFTSSTDPSDPGPLTFAQKDLFFTYQLTSSLGPYGLDNDSLWASEIIDHKTVSKNVLHSLQKIGVIVKEKGNVIDTTKIGPKFTHQVAEVGQRTQKRVVDLLFWWEEECRRLRKLDAEKGELEGMVGMEGVGEERKAMVKALLERVKNKMKTKPSERDEKVERDEDELMVRFREGTVGGKEGEAPPQYSRT